MSQTFQVLRCYKCLVFQVHQTKKSNKWDCKLCGEKQSIKRHYGIGTAKDCRLHVQRLNGLRGEIDNQKTDEDSGNSDNEDHTPITLRTTYQPLENSKWSNYVEETQAIEENNNDNMSLEGAEVVLEIPKKRRKQFHSNFKRNPKATKFHNGNTQEKCYNETATLKIIPDDDLENKEAQSLFLKSDLQSIDFSQQKKCNTNKNKIKSKFVSPVLNENSKWAQFTDNVQENESDMAPTPSITPTQNPLLFSLCDDSDLDNVLDI